MLNFIENIENALNQPNLFIHSWQAVIRVAITAIVFYILLVFILKFLGSRSVGNFSVYDFVATLTIGSTISSTLILSEATLLNGLLAVLIFLGLQYLISKITRKWPSVNKALNPTPKVVFFKGDFIEKNLNKARVNKNEVYSSIRMQARTTSDQVYAVIMETNGSLSVITQASEGYEDEITQYL